MSSGAPCKSSEATCVWLVPSVNEPIVIRMGPVPLRVETERRLEEQVAAEGARPEDPWP